MTNKKLRGNVVERSKLGGIEEKRRASETNKSKYLIIIDIVALMNQPGTAGPTLTCTSMNCNLNKEKKETKYQQRTEKNRVL